MDINLSCKLDDTHPHLLQHSHAHIHTNSYSGGSKTHRYKPSNCSESTRNQYQTSSLMLGSGGQCSMTERGEKKVPIQEQVRKIQMCLNYHMEIQYNSNCNNNNNHISGIPSNSVGKLRSLTQQKSQSNIVTFMNPNNLINESVNRLKMKSRRRMINNKNTKQNNIDNNIGQKTKQKRQLIQNMFKIGFKKKSYDQSAQKIVQQQTRKLTSMANGLQQFQKSKHKIHRQRALFTKRHKLTISQPILQNSHLHNYSYNNSNLSQILENQGEQQNLAMNFHGKNQTNNNIRFNQIIQHISMRSKDKLMQNYRSQPISPSKNKSIIENKILFHRNFNKNRTAQTSRTQKRLTKNQIKLITRSIQNKLKKSYRSSDNNNYNNNNKNCTKIGNICEQIKLKQTNLNNYFKTIGQDVQSFKILSSMLSSQNGNCLRVKRNENNIANNSDSFCKSKAYCTIENLKQNNPQSNNSNTTQIPQTFLKKLKNYHINNNELSERQQKQEHDQNYKSQQQQQQYKRNRNKCMNSNTNNFNSNKYFYSNKQNNFHHHRINESQQKCVQ